MFLLKRLSEKCEEISICLSGCSQFVGGVLAYLEKHLANLDLEREEGSSVNCLLIVQILANLAKFDLLKTDNFDRFQNIIFTNLDLILSKLEEKTASTTKEQLKALYLEAFLNSITLIHNQKTKKKSAQMDITVTFQVALLHRKSDLTQDFRKMPGIPHSPKTGSLDSELPFPLQILRKHEPQFGTNQAFFDNIFLRI